jgi:hypothetical protein
MPRVAHACAIRHSFTPAFAFSCAVAFAQILDAVARFTQWHPIYSILVLKRFIEGIWHH